MKEEREEQNPRGWGLRKMWGRSGCKMSFVACFLFPCVHCLVKKAREWWQAKTYSNRIFCGPQLIIIISPQKHFPFWISNASSAISYIQLQWVLKTSDPCKLSSSICSCLFHMTTLNCTPATTSSHVYTHILNFSQ